jgi:hypothetical protein
MFVFEIVLEVAAIDMVPQVVIDVAVKSSLGDGDGYDRR